MNNSSPINPFPLNQNTYAAFDAISLRNLIIERLNEQGTFTDQNYIGSNIASIIDIISYSFNTLLFYLNRTSTESTFTEAQLYENITRIVKLLDYKPIGYQTSTLAFSCSADSNYQRGIYTIPRYSYLTLGGIPFSFNEDVSFSVPIGNQLTPLSDLSNRKLLFQGTFRENTIYTATGDADEVVTINVANALIDHFNIHTYVFEKSEQKWYEYRNVPSLYSQNANSKCFEKKLNSNLLYEITFGDGINGRKLEEGDLVAVYYLQSSGNEGIVGPGALSNSPNKLLFNTPVFSEIQNSLNKENFNFVDAAQFSQLLFENVAGSTLPKDIETVDSIRKNAPANFKSQYRLVTASDIESYIRTNFDKFVADVKVFSNWDYTGKYLKYFHEIGMNPGGFQQVLLNQVLYADSCNFNNIYVCAIPKLSQGSTLKYLLPAQKELILGDMHPLKTITSEISFMDPIFKAISFGTKTNNLVTVNDADSHILEIVKTTANQRSNRGIQMEVADIFKQKLNPSNMKLGINFEYADIVSRILSINGVTKMRTRTIDSSVIFEGLSFYLWNPVYPELDKQFVVNNVALKEFELLYFAGLSTIENKIIVVEE